MIKYIAYFLIFLFIVFGCTIADSTSYTISVTNYSNIAVDNISVGTNFVGTVLPGQTVTYKYFTPQENAKIDIKGFSPFNSLFNDGLIDLRYAFNYKLTLMSNKTFNITGSSINSQDSIFME